MSLTLAREIAYDAFVAVMRQGAKPEEVLEASYAQHEGRISRLDRNFIKELVFGGLRWYSKLFWILQNTAKRDLEKASGEIQAALVLGTYQIYYLDRVPDRAAVNESVEYIRKKGQASACSFVNGILRQIARRAEYFAKPDKVAQPVAYLSLQFAHPEWIVERWHRQFKFEKMEAMLAANNRPPPYSVRVNSLKTELPQVIQLQQALLKSERTHSERRPLRSALRLKESPDVSATSLFSQGYFTIQDEAAQLVGFLVQPNPEERVLDICSGPGGKLSHLCEFMEGRGSIIAIERDRRQLERAQETIARFGFNNVTWIETDFLEWTSEEKFQKILLDAPCSGLGVLRRHPEGKWHKSASVIRELAAQQEKLLEKSLRHLEVGGELIYSVCSFEKEETEAHVETLLNKFGREKLEVVSPVSRLPDYYKKYVTRDNLLMIYIGNQDDMDGFGAFILKLKAPLD